MNKNHQHIEAKKAMDLALTQYIKEKSSAKELSLCMKEISAWLDKKAKQ